MSYSSLVLSLALSLLSGLNFSHKMKGWISQLEGPLVPVNGLAQEKIFQETENSGILLPA